MLSVKVASVVGAVCLIATASTTTSLAADMPGGLPPIYAPPIEEFVPASGWYLRGDIGMTNQQVKSLTNVLDAAYTSVNTVQKDFDSSPLFGVGVGYQWNDWLRTDITGEYRGKANFHGLQVTRFGVTPGTDEYRASKSEWMALANVYVDLGTWWCITPYVGAGAGFSRNTISNFMDINTPNGGVAYAADTSKWNFAWALHAGLSYKLNNQMAIEFGYRYVDLGSAISGDIMTYTGVNNVNNPSSFNNLTSHDFKLGVRWMLDQPVAAPQPAVLPPLMRRG